MSNTVHKVDVKAPPRVERRRVNKLRKEQANRYFNEFRMDQFTTELSAQKNLEVPTAAPGGMPQTGNPTEVQQDAKGGDAGGEVTENGGIVNSDLVADTPTTNGPRIIVNPSVFNDKRDALCVAYNEAFRIIMEETNFDPMSEPTEAQRKFFEDTAYKGNETMLRRTILARICTFDTSINDPTMDQLQEAVEFLDTVMEIGAPQNQEEQVIVATTREKLASVLEQSPVQEAPAPEVPEAPVEQPVEEPATVHADIGGGITEEPIVTITEEDKKSWDDILAPNEAEENDSFGDFDSEKDGEDHDSLEFLQRQYADAKANEQAMLWGELPVGGEGRGDIGQAVREAQNALQEHVSQKVAELQNQIRDLGFAANQAGVYDAAMSGAAQLHQKDTEVWKGDHDLNVFLNEQEHSEERAKGAEDINAKTEFLNQFDPRNQDKSSSTENQGRTNTYGVLTHNYARKSLWRHPLRYYDDGMPMTEEELLNM